MRFLMYGGDKGPPLGLLHGDEVIDPNALIQSRAEVPLPDLLGLIELGDKGLRLVQSLMDRVGAELPRTSLRASRFVPL
jgi:hypothetical protein